MALKRKAWDHGGKTAAERGYGREHRRLRAELLQREPLCRVCKAQGRVTLATIADHITPFSKGGAAHDIANLQPICAEHHVDKSNADKGHRVKRRISLSGWPED